MMEIAQGVSELKVLVLTALANQLNKPRGIEVKGRIAGLSPPPRGVYITFLQRVLNEQDVW